MTSCSKYQEDLRATPACPPWFPRRYIHHALTTPFFAKKRLASLSTLSGLVKQTQGHVPEQDPSVSKNECDPPSQESLPDAPLVTPTLEV